jgi:hypothetical protein
MSRSKKRYQDGSAESPVADDDVVEALVQGEPDA